VLAACDLLLSTSQSESLGIAMLEALACGIPVATTASEGPPDFICPANGVIVPADDAAPRGVA